MLGLEVPFNVIEAVAMGLDEEDYFCVPGDSVRFPMVERQRTGHATHTGSQLLFDHSLCESFRLSCVRNCCENNYFTVAVDHMLCG